MAPTRAVEAPARWGLASWDMPDQPVAGVMV